MKGARRAALVFVAALLCASGRPAGASLGASERSVLTRYLDALARGRYAAAFALLSPDEQRYFASPANFRSVFVADRLGIRAYRILGSKASPPLGSVAEVTEAISYFDHVHQTTRDVTVDSVYGVLGSVRPRVKDPLHPWRAVAPPDATGRRDGVAVTLRKLSFFSGRLEVVATFENASARAVTILPYGRSALRDEDGRTYPLLAPSAAFTDRILFGGLRLAPQAEYTGAMTFVTPARFRPRRLALTIAPSLFDGARTPFEITVPSVTVLRST